MRPSDKDPQAVVNFGGGDPGAIATGTTIRAISRAPDLAEPWRSAKGWAGPSAHPQDSTTIEPVPDPRPPTAAAPGCWTTATARTERPDVKAPAQTVCRMVPQREVWGKPD